MGLLTSRMFCNGDPTLPSTLFFSGIWSAGFAKVADKERIGEVDTQYIRPWRTLWVAQNVQTLILSTGAALLWQSCGTCGFLGDAWNVGATTATGGRKAVRQSGSW